MYQVLIVDDEPIVKIALRSMIDWESLGFHICATASNGEEALEMAERFHPDLVICDLKMPVMDGIDLIKAAKDKKMDCEFLVISNYEDFNYVRTALVLGASDYILKVSISPEELTSQLQKVKTKLEDKQAKKNRKTVWKLLFFTRNGTLPGGSFSLIKATTGKPPFHHRNRCLWAGNSSLCAKFPLTGMFSN